MKFTFAKYRNINDNDMIKICGLIKANGKSKLKHIKLVINSIIYSQSKIKIKRQR